MILSMYIAMCYGIVGCRVFRAIFVVKSIDACNIMPYNKIQISIDKNVFKRKAVNYKKEDRAVSTKVNLQVEKGA